MTANLTRPTLVILATLLLASPSWADEGERDDDDPRTITVVGTARLEVPSDHAILRLSIATTARTPAAAQKDTDAKIRALHTMLEARGIPKGDFETSYMSLQKQWHGGPQGEQVFDGYEATKSARIEIHDLSLYDTIMEGALELGVSSIEGVSFATTKLEERRREARIVAIRAAADKARYLTAELGAAVAEPLTIREMTAESPWPQPRFNVNVMAMQAGGDGGGAALAAGTIEIVESVEVVFRLDNKP